MKKNMMIAFCIIIIFSFSLLIPLCSGEEILDLKIKSSYPLFLNYKKTRAVYIRANNHFLYGFKASFNPYLLFYLRFEYLFRWWDVINDINKTTETRIDNNLKNWKNNSLYKPFYDELEGLWKGIITRPCFHKLTLIEFVYFLELTFDRTVKEEDMCTSSLTTGDATLNKNTILQQNIDWIRIGKNFEDEFTKLNYRRIQSKLYYIVEIDGEYSYAFWGLPIVQEFAFINEKGLGFGGNGMTLRELCDVDEGEGISSYWLYRKTMMECKNVDEVNILWDSNTRAAGRDRKWPYQWNNMNMIFCDSNGGIIAIEQMHTYYQYYKKNPDHPDKKDILWHSNHHKWNGEFGDTGSVRKISTPDDKPFYPSTFARGEGIYSLLTHDEKYGEWNLKKIKNHIAKNHSLGRNENEDNWDICRHPEKLKTNEFGYEYGTVFSWLIEPEKKYVHWTRVAPCEQGKGIPDDPYIKHDFNDIFNSNIQSNKPCYYPVGYYFQFGTIPYIFTKIEEDNFFLDEFGNNKKYNDSLEVFSIISGILIGDNEQGNHDYTVSLTNANYSLNSSSLNIKIKPDGYANASLEFDDPINRSWKTIQKAIDNMTNLDILVLKNGSYNEDIIINKSLIILGEDKNNVTISGSITMINPHDYELLNITDSNANVNMTGIKLLLHFNNDSRYGENYSNSTIVLDCSGQNNNGTNNNASWTTSTIKGAGAFDFNGINNSIKLSSIPALYGENITISSWIKWKGGSGASDTILSQSNNTHGYCLYINNTNNKPVFRLDDTSVISLVNLTNGWHNVVGVHNETTLNLIIDGKPSGTITKSGFGTDKDCYIGYDNISSYYNGTIDEVAVWNRALSNSEILHIYRQHYGVTMNGFTIQNSSNAGIFLINHTDLSDIILKNHVTGIFFNNVSDVIVRCNISNCTLGIKINNSNPDQYNKIRIVNCSIDENTDGLFINSSSHIDVIYTYINSTNDFITIKNSNYSLIDIIDTIGEGNVSPDQPSLSGPTLGLINTSYTFFSCTNDSNDDEIFYMFDWGDGNNSGWLGPYSSNIQINASHSWTKQGGYWIRIRTKDIFYNESNHSIYFKTETLPPLINTVNNTPDIVGYGFNITITANVTDDKSGNNSGIKSVFVNISYPNNEKHNFSMRDIENDTYEYVFYATWLTGQYNYTIWAKDNANNLNSSTDYNFNVTGQATLSIATLKDSYGTNEYINITDPPSPSNDYYLVGRGHTWNKYYNATSGKNVLEVYTRPINYQDKNNEWTPIECNISVIDYKHPANSYGYNTGNDHGLYNVYFKPNAQDSWPVVFAYNKSINPRVHTIRSKLVGVGYLDPSQNWTYEYLQNVQSSLGQINNKSITYKNVFNGTDVVWTYGNTGLKEEIIMSNTTKVLLQNHSPSDYNLNNQQAHLVFITKLDYSNLQLYNSSSVLTNNFTTSANIELKDIFSHFKCSFPVGEIYELNNESVRHRLTNRFLQYNNNYYVLSGLKVTDLNDMTFPVVIDPTLTVTSSSNDGDITGDGTPYSTVQGASKGSPIDNAATFFIGQKCESMGPPPPPPLYFIYRGCVYFDTSPIPSPDLIDSVTLKLYKDSDYSTTDFDIVVQNGQPTYPHAPMVPGDYDKDHYSGNGGSMNTSSFSSGYNEITITNHSWINTSGTTKFYLRSSRDINSVEPTGNEYVTVSSSGTNNEEPKLVVVYRNQSKIKNTGSTDIMGYLLMQIHFCNATSGPCVDHNTINENTPRIINSSEQLALDLIFNGLVNTNDLSNGDGTYRVYAAFRDSEGNILKTNDEKEMVSWYEFTVTFT
jgi:hypothetical protein